MDRTLINVAATTIHKNGVKIFEQDTPYYEKWKMVFHVTMTSSILLSLFMGIFTNRNDIFKVIETFPHFALTSILLGGTIITFYHGRSISKMLHQMDKAYEYPDDVLLEVESKKWYHKEENIMSLIRVSKYSGFTFLFLLTGPFFCQMYTDGIIDTFPYPCWTPWTLDSAGWQLFTLALQVVQGLSMVSCYHTITVYLLVSISDFITQYEKLKRAVESLKSRTSHFVLNDRRFKDRFDQLMRENIVHCVKHHQMLHKNFRLFDTFFRTFFSWILGVHMVASAFALYVAINASNFFAIFYGLEISACINLIFFIFCFFGEVLYDLNDELANTIFYETEWYEATKENRSLLVLFHALACRPFCLMGFSIYQACYKTFGDMINSTYSNFNNLRDIMKK